MVEANEILAKFFRKRPEIDTDGVFHYLLQERQATLVVDTTPIQQWTPEILENTLIVDCERNEIGMCWIRDGIYRAIVAPFPVNDILYREDEGAPELVFAGSDVVVSIGLTPGQLNFHVFTDDYFYRMLYNGRSYRVLFTRNRLP